MNRVVVKEGFTYTSTEGYTVCNGYNGSIVYCTEHETDIDGNETGNTNEQMLTLNEIAHRLKDFDYGGRNCKVVWSDED